MAEFSTNLKKRIENAGMSTIRAAEFLEISIEELQGWLDNSITPHFLMQIGALNILRQSATMCKTQKRRTTAGASKIWVITHHDFSTETISNLFQWCRNKFAGSGEKAYHILRKKRSYAGYTAQNCDGISKNA